MKKLVNGELVDLTHEEISQRTAEEQDVLARKPIEEKQEKLKALDGAMPRYIEDIVEVLSPTVKAKLPKEMLDRIKEKQELRESKGR